MMAGTRFVLAFNGVGAVTWGMDGPSDDMEGVVSESEDDVSAGGDHGSNNDPFPQAGVDGRESVTERYEARSSRAGLISLLSSSISSCVPSPETCVSARVSQAPAACSIARV